MSNNSMQAINRALQPLVIESLGNFPVVYINGPRQAGKTTLVKELLAPKFRAEYISFDDALERAAAVRNPLGYLKESGTPLIIDEVQMVPELFRPLKLLVDEHRQEVLSTGGTAAGDYLLTGSANLTAMPALADAMVGRMAHLTLLPLSINEVIGRKLSFLERCFSKDFTGIKTTDDITLLEAMRQASFPELLKMSPNMQDSWFKNYIQKITLDDPRQLYNLEKAEYMPVLLQALAARAGNLLNDAAIGREIGLNAVTTRNYRGLLNHSFITNTLRPWYRNITKRLVKAHKIYFHDTMLLSYLLGSSPAAFAKTQPQRFGHILENFVLAELVKANHASGEKVDISFYRTNDGHEVDFILEQQHRLVAIEVKNAENIANKDIAGIKELQQATGDDFYCGIVLCNTQRVIAFDQNIYLLPFTALWH